MTIQNINNIQLMLLKLNNIGLQSTVSYFFGLDKFKRMKWTYI